MFVEAYFLSQNRYLISQMRSQSAVFLCPVVLFIKAFPLKGHRVQYIIVGRL